MIAGIYAANLHHGGGASGAAVFVSDLPALWREGELAQFERLEVDLSSTVAKSVQHIDQVAAVPVVDLTVRDDRPGIGSSHSRKQSMDAQFVIRGPHYAANEARRMILGFADATMVFPSPRGIPQSRASRAELAIKNLLKRPLLHRYGAYVVQTERLARRLREIVGEKPIHVVPNSPAELFREATADNLSGSPGTHREGNGGFVAIFPARGYAHKNHEIIGAVGDELQARHGIRFRVIVTLRPQEFERLTPRTRSYCYNAGEQDLEGLRRLYASADACFFPSLNETASATPLEAMAMGLPVIGSDRRFVRDVARDVPYYFEPTNFLSAAEAVKRCLSSGSTELRKQRGLELVEALPSAMDRSRAYIRILSERLN